MTELFADIRSRALDGYSDSWDPQDALNDATSDVKRLLIALDALMPFISNEYIDHDWGVCDDHSFITSQLKGHDNEGGFKCKCGLEAIYDDLPFEIREALE